MQSTLNDTDPATWQQLAPLLDEAMGHLGETDRTAVVLRYFENRSAAQVAAALNTSEGAVYKRVTRSLDKLRKIFARRGVMLSAAAIAAAVSANSVQAAPAALAQSITAAALAKDPTLEGFSGYVQDSGEGRWTIEAAIEEAVPVDVLAAALFARFRSRQDKNFGNQILSAMRLGFGGHIEGKEAIDAKPAGGAA